MSDQHDSPKPSHKVGRSKSGCQTCRARRVRCDERPGICLNCEKLGLPCAPPGTSSSPDHHQNGTDPSVSSSSTALKRKRTFRSCTGCRASKTRCSGDRPVCSKCRQKSLQCNYDDSSAPGWMQQMGLMTDQSDSGELAQSRPSGSNEHGSHYPGSALEDQGPTTYGPYDNNDSRSSHQPYPDSTWLKSSKLPRNEMVRALVEYYFLNIHPIRCFGFLHKPSFMQRLDTEDTSNREDDALLLVVCAMGALFFAAEHHPTETPASILAAGSQWAKRAQELILAQLGDICVENLMAAILLHDYELRMANFGNAFMLSGLTARMAQALQINLEHSTDILCEDTSSSPGASTKESRRRLMWCCYVSDSLVGSGVDQLTLIKEEDIKIQLPCNERNFLLQTACITEVLESGQFLKFLRSESLPSYPLDNMGIRAYYLRFVSIRRKVLKYIKHLYAAKSPWLPDSEFAQLDAECRRWHNSLPPSLRFTPTATYIRKETSQLGALTALQYLYHQNMCDLYRIGAPALYKLRWPFSFPPEQTGFLRHLQNTFFEHARNLALIMAESLRYGPHALADSLLPTVTYDCCRILLYYVTQLIDPNTASSEKLMADTIPLVRSNIQALKTMQSMYVVAELLTNAAEKMLEKVGVGSSGIRLGQSIIFDEPYPNNDENEAVEQSIPGTPVQSAPDYVLNPLSIYRMARKAIPEKHAPEKQLNAPLAAATANGRHVLQRRVSLQHVPYDGGNMVDTTNVPSADTFTTVGDLPYGAPTEQAGLNDLISLFTSDPSGWAWQPSDTAIGSQMESSGLPPWEPNDVDQQLDAWMPIFSGQAGQLGYQ